jgi:DNA-binding winged helix-turn-helix (wHTH) protein
MKGGVCIKLLVFLSLKDFESFNNRYKCVHFVSYEENIKIDHTYDAIIISIHFIDHGFVEKLNARLNSYFLPIFLIDLSIDHIDEVMMNISKRLKERNDQLSIDSERYQVHYHHEEIKLTQMAFKVFHYIFKNQNRIITKDELTKAIWGIDDPATDNAMSIHISRINHQFRNICGFNSIDCLHKQGYRLNEKLTSHDGKNHFYIQ